LKEQLGERLQKNEKDYEFELVGTSVYWYNRKQNIVDHWQNQHIDKTTTVRRYETRD
jgi:hypothetical protein